MFKFSGRRPKDLGVRDGAFTAERTWKPNWVSSQVDAGDRHYIAPIKVGTGAGGDAMARLGKVIAAWPRAKVIEQKGNYLYAEFSTALMGFTDDVEFHYDGKALQVRSSSRLGVRDFDVNRKRVEELRAQLA